MHVIEMCQRPLSSDLTTVQARCLLQFVAVHLFDLIGPTQACVVFNDILDLCVKCLWSTTASIPIVL